MVGRFNQIVAEPPDTRGSVLANLTTALAPWDNQLIAGVTSRSDFDIRLLRRKRMTIYIGPPPSDLESYRSLIRLLVQQVHDALMRGLPGQEDGFDVLVMLDEFRQLQRMDAIVDKIPISAGYGFRIALILQNFSQLDEIYGKPTRGALLRTAPSSCSSPSMTSRPRITSPTSSGIAPSRPQRRASGAPGLGTSARSPRA